MNRHHLDRICAFLYLLAGGAFVIAGALTFRFILFLSFRDGMLLSLVVYVVILLGAWLAARFDNVA